MAAPPTTLLPLALIVLLGGALPNVGGWGPREGVAAWAFAAAGLGASAGVATSVAYGVMVLVAACRAPSCSWRRGPPGTRRDPPPPERSRRCLTVPTPC